MSESGLKLRIHEDACPHKELSLLAYFTDANMEFVGNLGFVKIPKDQAEKLFADDATIVLSPENGKALYESLAKIYGDSFTPNYHSDFNRLKTIEDLDCAKCIELEKSKQSPPKSNKSLKEKCRIEIDLESAFSAIDYPGTFDTKYQVRDECEEICKYGFRYKDIWYPPNRISSIRIIKLT